MSSTGTTQNTLVAYWSLDKDQNKVVDTELWTNPEVSFSDDNRTVVDDKDFAVNGKYHSIVKLFIQFKNQSDNSTSWAMATGWMISSDVLVTAGHCAYDWGFNLGRARTIKAYLGYKNGKWSQFRTGKMIATTAGWLEGSKNKTKDVSFVQLESAFNNVVPFQYTSTPLANTEDLYIVGYPADKVDPKTKERGGQMYVGSGSVTYDLRQSDLMLSYHISTAGGQSGSPVLRSDQVTSIAAHVLGGRLMNSGTPIGTYGNWYPPYIKVFSNTYPVVKTFGDITYVSVPPDSQAESFSQARSSIAKIGSRITADALIASSPFLGPIGSPLAALAGTILGWAGSFISSSLGPETAFPVGLSQNNFTERAILAEAALQLYLNTPVGDWGEVDIDSTIESIYPYLSPSFGRLGPKLLPLLMGHGLRVGSDSVLVRDRVESATATEADLDKTRQELTQPEDTADNEIDPPANVQKFMDALLVPSYHCAGEETFFDDLSTVISAGLKLALPIMSTAISGLSALNCVMPTEASIMQTDADKDLQLLCKRAVMGEAVLQSLFTIDTAKLPENFMDNFKDLVQRIGRQVRTLAPVAISIATPVLKELLKGEQPDPTASTGTQNIAQTTSAATAENRLRALRSRKDKKHPDLKKPLLDILLEAEEGPKDGNMDGIVFTQVRD